MRKEIRRQFTHFFFGSMLIALIVLLGMRKALAVLAVVFIAGLAASYLIKRGIRLPGFIHMLERVEREHEKHLPGKGALVFFLGAVILMLLFKEQSIVLGALCVSVYGDAASTVFGLRFGKHRLVGKRTLEGTLGGILVSLIFLGILFEWQIALAAAVIGMLAELLPIDDSISIPIVSAIVLTLL